MTPKPFPFPIEVGVDICRTARVASLLRQEHTRNRWAQRIFTRLEWPAIIYRFARVNRADGETRHQLLKREQRVRQGRERTGDLGPDVWMLPNLSNLSSIFEDQERYRLEIGDERSLFGNLARSLAGRWAAKEAVIKAHCHRQLYMHEISILTPRDTQGSHVPGKLIALVDPLSDTIEIDEHVASQRQLRGFGPRSQGLRRGSLVGVEDDNESLHSHPEKLTGKATRYHRRAKVRGSDRQVAKINISHDGDYAVAVCMAFDPPGIRPEQKFMVDDGRGPPKHEPQWGDEGWFDFVNEPMVQTEEEGVEDLDMRDILEEQNSVHSPEALRKIVEQALEGSEDDDARRLPPLP